MRARLLHLDPKTHGRLVRLSKKAERDGAYRVVKRLKAIVLNSEGRTSGEVARILKAPRSRVSEWLSLYQRHGVDGLLEGYRTGRPSSLTAEQRVELGKILDRGPRAYALDPGTSPKFAAWVIEQEFGITYHPGYVRLHLGRWTSPKFAASVIEQEFGITYHPGHVRKLLHQMGFFMRRPRRILAPADATAQDRWHRRTYPNLKKKPKPKAGR